MIDILVEKIKKTNNPTVVGLDPRLEYIPEHIKEEAFNLYGKTPKAVAEAFLRFNKEIIDEIYDLVPAVKPQIAMYEEYGFEGVKAYIDTIKYAKEKGLIVIGDIKRGDITSTAKAYSNAHIGRTTIDSEEHRIFDHDFITLNPYMGYDSIEPYIDDCRNYNKGIIVLVKTSNPNSGQLQNLDVGGELLYERVGKLVSQWGEDLIGESGYSKVCAVVGATHPEEGKKLRSLMPHTFFLVPGYGAQGGKAEDLRGVFDQDGLGAIINSSRGIITAYKNDKYKEFGSKEHAKAARQAVIHMKNDLQGVRG